MKISNIESVILERVSLAKFRYKADIRQYGGFALAISTLITMCSMSAVMVAAAAGKEGTSYAPLGKFFDLIDMCFLGLIGKVGMFIGFSILVNDESGLQKYGAKAALLALQLAWVPFLWSFVEFGFAVRACFAADGGGQTTFIPSSLQPTCSDDAVVGAMGILGYATTLASSVGSLGFFLFAIVAYESGHAKDRPASYYRSRSLYFNVLVLLAGASQFVLGCYLAISYGTGPYAEPVMASVYTVSYPSISIVVGWTELVVGLLGLGRGSGLADSKSDVGMFQSVCALLWTIILILQNAVQVGSALGSDRMGSSSAPSLGWLALTLAMMPAYLDKKMHTVPREIKGDYYDRSCADTILSDEDVSVITEVPLVTNDKFNSFRGLFSV